jgi:hypothetical protein
VATLVVMFVLMRVLAPPVRPRSATAQAR